MIILFLKQNIMFVITLSVNITAHLLLGKRLKYVTHVSLLRCLTLVFVRIMLLRLKTKLFKLHNGGQTCIGSSKTGATSHPLDQSPRPRVALLSCSSWAYLFQDRKTKSLTWSHWGHFFFCGMATQVNCHSLPEDKIDLNISASRTRVAWQRNKRGGGRISRYFWGKTSHISQ